MNQRRSIIYLVGGFVVFISIVVSFVVLPLIYEMAGRADDLIAKKKNLDYLSEMAQVSNDEINDLGGLLADIKKLYIDPRRPVDRIIFLEQVASDNRLAMDINITGPEKDDVWPYLNLIISLRGDSNDLYRFIEIIQTANWIATIDRLNVRKVTERDLREGDPVLSERSVIADLSLRVYFKE